MRSSSPFMVAPPPPTSSRLWTRSSGSSSAQTPDDTMLMGNRAPSSLWQPSAAEWRGRARARAGFVGYALRPVHDANGELGLHPVVTEDAQHFDARQHT